MLHLQRVEHHRSGSKFACAPAPFIGSLHPPVVDMIDLHALTLKSHQSKDDHRIRDQFFMIVSRSHEPQHDIFRYFVLGAATFVAFATAAVT